MLWCALFGCVMTWSPISMLNPFPELVASEPPIHDMLKTKHKERYFELIMNIFLHNASQWSDDVIYVAFETMLLREVTQTKGEQAGFNNLQCRISLAVTDDNKNKPVSMYELL